MTSKGNQRVSTPGTKSPKILITGPFFDNNILLYIWKNSKYMKKIEF
jgi:hypothetical protein